VTQAGQIDQTISQERTFATLCVCFAVLAALIACVGLYGMMAYSVARRTNEIAAHRFREEVHEGPRRHNTSAARS